MGRLQGVAAAGLGHLVGLGCSQPSHPTCYCHPAPAVVCHVDFALSSVASRAQLPGLLPDLQPAHGERHVRHGPGAVVGELDFFLQRPRR